MTVQNHNNPKVSNSTNSNDCSPNGRFVLFVKLRPEKLRAFFLILKGLKIFAVSVFYVEYVYKKKPLAFSAIISKRKNFSNIFKVLPTRHNPINVK
jgi:hypothetical protein